MQYAINVMIDMSCIVVDSHNVDLVVVMIGKMDFAGIVTLKKIVLTTQKDVIILVYRYVVRLTVL